MSTTKKNYEKRFDKFYKIIKSKGNKIFAVYDYNTKIYIGNVSLTEIDYDNKHCKYGRFLGNENFSIKIMGNLCSMKFLNMLLQN